MESKSSLAYAQQAANCKYPEPDQSHLRPEAIYWRSILIFSFLYIPRFSKWTLSIRFPHQNPVYSSPLPYLCHIPRPSLLLDLITPECTYVQMLKTQLLNAYFETVNLFTTCFKNSKECILTTLCSTSYVRFLKEITLIYLCHRATVAGLRVSWQ